MESWVFALWSWHLLVAIFALVAALCLCCTKRLRLHSVAVLLGAGSWFLYWLAFVPWLISSTPRASFDDNTTGIGLAVAINFGAVLLGGYHGLLCVALLV